MITLNKLEQKYKNKIPSLDFWILISHATKKSKEWLLAHPTYKLQATSYFLFRYYTWLYRRGFSVAAITHHKEFYGIDFYVNKHTLIPRPDTEMMVEEAVKIIRQQTADSGITLVDVGTGSGCIPISILKNSENKNIQTFATDISSKALRVARRNARAQNVSIHFLHGNLLEPALNHLYKLHPNSYNLVITANLPYLTQPQFDSEPSIHREPHSALVASEEGLALYRELLSQIQSLLQANSCQLQAFLEIDPSQSQKIAPLIKTYLPNASIEIKKDLSGHDRLVVIHQSV